MIKIAICDDDVNKGIWVASYIERSLKEKALIFEKDVFSSSRNLLYEIEDGTKYDLLLLDIEMPNIDGIELTAHIKKYLPEALVIFITSYEKYVYESFKVQPFRFVPKRYAENMLSSAIDDALSVIEKNVTKYLFVENQEGLEKIPTKTIMYIWHREKYAYLERTNGKTTKVRKTLKQVFDELPKGDFVWIDRGCICNLMQISKIGDGYVWLLDGNKLPASRDRLTEVKSMLRKYWMGTEVDV